VHGGACAVFELGPKGARVWVAICALVRANDYAHDVREDWREHERRNRGGRGQAGRACYGQPFAHSRYASHGPPIGQAFATGTRHRPPPSASSEAERQVSQASPAVGFIMAQYSLAHWDWQTPVPASLVHSQLTMALMNVRYEFAWMFAQQVMHDDVGDIDWHCMSVSGPASEVPMPPLAPSPEPRLPSTGRVPPASVVTGPPLLSSPPLLQPLP
jgi:hypothetical protein